MRNITERQDFADDGRTVADMNLEGMPWHNPHVKRRMRCGDYETEKIRLTTKERAAITKAALSAVLPLIAFFGAGYAAVMLFLQLVWLR